MTYRRRPQQPSGRNLLNKVLTGADAPGRVQLSHWESSALPPGESSSAPKRPPGNGRSWPGSTSLSPSWSWRSPRLPAAWPVPPSNGAHAGAWPKALALYAVTPLQPDEAVEPGRRLPSTPPLPPPRRQHTPYRSPRQTTVLLIVCRPIVIAAPILLDQICLRRSRLLAN